MDAPPTPTERRRIALTIVGLLAAVAVGLAILTIGGVSPAAGQVGVSMGQFDVADTETTVDGDVTSVMLETTVGYNQSVGDAQQRIVKLRAGPSEDELTTVTFRRSDDAADGRDTVTLSGDLLEAGFTREDFTPALAGTKTTTVVVEAVVEVERANGQRITKRATDTATVTVHDDGTLSLSIGGTGTISVYSE